MNRRLVGSLATVHFASTERNREAVLKEGVAPSSIVVTGNPVVDALETILMRRPRGGVVAGLLASTVGFKRVVLTTHRRENFGSYMGDSLSVLRRFIEAHEDVVLMFPVHPNPKVVRAAELAFGGHPRIHLLEPLNYEDFLLLLSHAWLVVSDSGGVQEEAPSLGKPLIILHANTERPEALECGIARLVGECPDHLAALLAEARQADSWVERVGTIRNPFGSGDAGERIVTAIGSYLLDSKPVLAVVQ